VDVGVIGGEVESGEIGAQVVITPATPQRIGKGDKGGVGVGEREKEVVRMVYRALEARVLGTLGESGRRSSTV
jgi:hypothetical protein